jgi:hypothetical protein
VKYFFRPPKTFVFADFFLKKAICKKQQQAVKFHRHALYFYLTLSRCLRITKQTRSASFRKTFPVSFQENFLQISNTQTGKYLRSSFPIWKQTAITSYQNPFLSQKVDRYALITRRHSLNCTLGFAPHSSSFQNPAKREMLKILK